VASKRPLVLVFGLLVAGAVGVWLWSARDRGDVGRAGPGASAPQRGGELVALLRSEPTTYLRVTEVQGTAAGDLYSLLSDGRLVRVNRATDVLEPGLAERWTEAPDHLSYTLTLREGLAFSDGSPLTSADVLFSFRAAYDPRLNSSLALSLKVAGQPLAVEAPDARTIVVRLPSAFAPGLRLVENLPIIPRHKLEAAFDQGRLGQTWGVGTPPSEIVTSGPFVLREHASGQRMTFARNPHYWQKADDGTALPYLDTLVVQFVPDQNAEALRMQSGDADVMSNADIRPEDYAAFRRLAEEGRMRLIDAGVGLDPNLLWFNLTAAKAADPRSAWLQRKEFRHAISCAVDRQAIANAVFLGEAVPIHGPVSPGNRTWYTPPANPCNHDLGRARELLASAGLTDRNGDGMLDDATGAPARFSILTQSGHTIRERTVSMLQEQLRQVGLAVDVVALDPGGVGRRWFQGDYDSIYFGVQASSTDPASNREFWLSSGPFHFWNRAQATPATEWERRIDELMVQQAAASDLTERQRLFAEVQRVFEAEMPALYFVAPKVTIAVSGRVRNERPAPQVPQLLWSAETLAVTGPRR
jgi:peptide/nickel transport system substrate-binding protein